MQQETLGTCRLLIRSGAIEVISNNGVTDPGQVNANLMLAPRYRLHAEKGRGCLISAYARGMAPHSCKSCGDGLLFFRPSNRRVHFLRRRSAITTTSSTRTSAAATFAAVQKPSVSNSRNACSKSSNSNSFFPTFLQRQINSPCLPCYNRNVASDAGYVILHNQFSIEGRCKSPLSLDCEGN